MRQDPTLYGLPAYPKTEPLGPCVCGSWPGGECLQCPVVCARPPVGWRCTREPRHPGPCAAWPAQAIDRQAAQHVGGMILWTIGMILAAGAAIGAYLVLAAQG